MTSDRYREEARICKHLGHNIWAKMLTRAADLLDAAKAATETDYFGYYMGEAEDVVLLNAIAAIEAIENE